MAIRSVDEMMTEARKSIDNITPAEAKRRADDEGAIIVDIRDVRELQRTGVIAGAIHAPRGMLEFWVDPQSKYFKPIFAQDVEYVFH